MKKLFIFIAVLFTVMACDPKVDFNKLMEDDYIAASLEFPNSDIRLYEVQTVMSAPANAEKNEILASSTIIQVGKDSVKQIDRTYYRGRIEATIFMSKYAETLLSPDQVLPDFI